LHLATEQGRARASFYALQEWEGYVTEILEDSFRAILVDITAKSSEPEEQIQLSFDELAFEEDKSSMRIGSIFRWAIGYERMASGQRKRVSQILFRKRPAWTKADLSAARSAAQRQSEKLRWE
jgi:hypothetical protein